MPPQRWQPPDQQARLALSGWRLAQQGLGQSELGARSEKEGRREQAVPL